MQEGYTLMGVNASDIVSLINDELLNRKEEPFDAEFVGSMAEFKAYIEKNL